MSRNNIARKEFLPMKILSFIFAALTALFVVGSSIALAQPAGAVSLAYKLEKGKTYRYASHSEMQSTQTMMGNEVTSTVFSHTVLHILVENVDKDGNITYVWAVDSATTRIQNPRIDTTFINPEGLIGKRTRSVMTKFGKTVSTAPVDSIILPMGMGRRAGSATPSFMEFKEVATKLGETVNHTRVDTMDQPGGKIAVTYSISYTVGEKVSKSGYDCYKIPYKGTTSYLGRGTMMGMDMVTEGSGTVSGTVYFATKEGLLIESETTSQQELTTAVTGQQSMTIPTSQTVKTTITLLR